MIKRKRLDRDRWSSIIRKGYEQRKIEDSDFTGIIALLDIQAVSQVSTWQAPYGSITVCDAGIRWLQFLPQDGHWVMTAMFDSDDRIRVYYIDIIASSGLDEDGVAWFDDMYLDLVVYPNGNVLIDDRDELLAAYRNEEITREQFELAQRTQFELLDGLLADVGVLEAFCRKYLSLF